MSDIHDVRVRAKLKSEALQELKNSTKYRRVIGLLTSLDLLVSVEPVPKTVSKVELKDVLEIGRKVEPRVLEVLPAALLSSPKSFFHIDEAPEDLQQVVSALEKGEEGPDFESVPFKKIYEAANRPVKDKRRKRVSERRVSKTFRFSRDIWNALQKQCHASGMDYTAYLESLVHRDLGV